MFSRVLALTVLLSASFSAFADEAEDRAIEAVKKLGGRVIHQDRDPAKPVIQINGRGRTFTDASLKDVLAGLRHLQTLNIGATNVTDAGLKEVAGLKDLQTLHLCYSDISDQGLRELSALKGLKTLGLAETKVTDAGMKELAGMQTLQMLLLDRTAVTDAGLKELAGLQNLQTLSLYNTKVTDAGVEELKKALPTLNIRR